MAEVSSRPRVVNLSKTDLHQRTLRHPEIDLVYFEKDAVLNDNTIIRYIALPLPIGVLSYYAFQTWQLTSVRLADCG
jgi:hypothetical protein